MRGARLGKVRSGYPRGQGEPSPEANVRSALGADSLLSPPIFAHTAEGCAPIRPSISPRAAEKRHPRMAKPFYDGSRRSVNRKREVGFRATSVSPSRRGACRRRRALVPRVYPRRRTAPTVRGEARAEMGERRISVSPAGRHGWPARPGAHGGLRAVAKQASGRKAPARLRAGRPLRPEAPMRRVQGVARLSGVPEALPLPPSGPIRGFGPPGSAAEAVRSRAGRCCPARRGRG